MPLTVAFKETVMKRLKRDPEFAQALLREGIEALFSNELDVGKDLLRDYVNGTIGFERLAKVVGISTKSLMRMLGPNGNPRVNNLSSIIVALQRHAGVEFHISSTLRGKTKRPERAKKNVKPYRESSHTHMAFEEAGSQFKR